MNPLPRFTDLTLTEPGQFSTQVLNPISGTRYGMDASFWLFLLREAWERGMDDSAADGFAGFAVRVSGSGAEIISGAPGSSGDWSAVRDSTPEAQAVLFGDSLNFLFSSGRVVRFRDVVLDADRTGFQHRGLNSTRHRTFPEFLADEAAVQGMRGPFRADDMAAVVERALNHLFPSPA